MRTRVTVTAVLLVLGGFTAPAVLAHSARVAGCARPAPGGEWRSYGHDLANSRNQPDEHRITAANVGRLAPVWKFSNGNSGAFNVTPTVADGCVFAGDEAGHVYALNADNGQVVWRATVPDPVESSVAVHGGRVFVSVDRISGPYLVALSERTGRLLWRRSMDHTFGSDTYSSPVVFDGMVIAGVSAASAEAGTTVCPPFAAQQFGCGGGPQSRLRFRGVYVIVDAKTGRLLHKDHVISDADFRRGFAGGGIWSTAAVDPRTRYAYFGTGNPFSAHEHPHTNAIVKIDLNRHRRTFGRVVGAFHGTSDLYVDRGTYKPVCDVYVDVFTCDPPDFDFGASPQLFHAGRRGYVGDMQKSGVYTAGDARTMKVAWRAVVGGPFGQVGGEATASYDGKRLYTGGSAPGLLTALAPRDGSRTWLAPIADGVHFQSVSTAGGVTYTTDTRGFLDAWDSATGRMLLARPLGTDINEPTYQEFSAVESVAIARHTVYVPADGYLLAYRPTG